MGMAEFRVLVQQTAADTPLQVTLLADEEIRALPPEQATERLSSLLHQVRVRPEFTIYGFGTFASYVERPNPGHFRGYNTLVEVNLPYTLHLPSGMLFPVADQQGVVRGLLQTRKIWTDLADGSNNVEALADDQLLYHGPALPATPHVPQDPVLGPWPRFTGQNVELGKDTHGIFRYTQVRLLFDTEHTGIDGEDDAEAVKEARNVAVITATSTAAEFVNHLLDVYRHVTGENHVERLPRQLVTKCILRTSTSCTRVLDWKEALALQLSIDRAAKSTDSQQCWQPVNNQPPIHCYSRAPDQHWIEASYFWVWLWHFKRRRW